MTDPRIEQLAHSLVTYSCEVAPGENVLIENTGFEPQLVNALIREVYRAGGRPFVQIRDGSVQRELITGATKEQLAIQSENDAWLMSRMQAYIGLRSGSNANELADVPEDRLLLYRTDYSRRVHNEHRVPHTKWVVLRYPSPSMAQSAGMSTAAFEDFYFRVCNLDYGKMERAMQKLVDVMQRTDRVRIVGPGTDLRFSIRGNPAVPCAGRVNVPDGEVFTAPVRDSVEGTIRYNTPSLYNGFAFENVTLQFEKGRIVAATCNDDARIEALLNTDEGARYVGEFAIGVNPHILEPMKDTLFDEKIMGSFHFTPGNAYDECDNGNRSSVHWDLVCIQRPEYGGGEMYFDDVLVRKDGRFVIDELACLNPENLA